MAQEAELEANIGENRGRRYYKSDLSLPVVTVRNRFAPAQLDGSEARRVVELM